MESHFFPTNKTRFVLIIFVGIVLTVIGIAGVIATMPTGMEVRPALVTKALGATAVIGVLVVLLGLINLFSQKRGLTINNAGISLHAGLVKFGPIAWDDIAGVEEKKYMTNTFIVLKLKNPEKFLLTLKGMAKYMASDSQRLSGSPAVINTNMLAADKDHLLGLIVNRIGK